MKGYTLTQFGETSAEKKMRQLLKITMKLSICMLIACLIMGVFFPDVAYGVDVNTSHEAGKKIAAGGFHGIAINHDGTVEAWGNDNQNQCKVPTGLSDVIAVSGGYTFSMALKSDGTVEVWGNNTYNQCIVPTDLSNVKAISAGYYHGLALKEDGTVVGWGLNNKGQRTITGSNNVAVAGGRLHSLALKADGTVEAFGADGMGQCTVPTGLSDVVDVSAGYYHSIALKSDGTVVAWGANDQGQRVVPASISDVVAVSAGGYFNLALKLDGTVVAWGSNSHGQTDVPDGLSDVVAVSAGYNYSLALKSDGTVVTWGNNNQFQCNVPEGLNLSGCLSDLVVSEAITPNFNRDTLDYSIDVDNDITQLELTATLEDDDANQLSIQVQGEESGTSLPLEEGVNSVIVEVSTPSCGLKRTYTLTVNRAIVIPENVIASKEEGKKISAGYFFSMVLKPDGTAVAWGDNGFYQCVVPENLSGVMVSAGGNHALALRTEGAIEAWGNNDINQCNPPTGLSEAVAVAAGFKHSLALKSNDTVEAWGANDKGQCDVPIGLSNVVEVSAGMRHSLALKSNGMVEVWGATGLGQCDVPLGLSGVVAVSAGYNHSLALKSDGTVEAWGDNGSFQCEVPNGLTDVVAVSAGGNHSLALKSDGTVVAWGDNTKGQCNVSELTDVVAISAGWYHSLALKSDGTVVAWGAGGRGQCEVPEGLNLSGCLSGLAVSEAFLIPEFDSEILDYVIYVDNATTELELTATLADKSHKLYIQDQEQEQESGVAKNISSLLVGSNIVTVEVSIPSSRLLRRYTMNINRMGETLSPSVDVTKAKEAGRRISAGQNHSLALKNDGRIVAWGSNGNDNGEGKCDVPEGLFAEEVSAGQLHSLAIRTGGAIEAWGDNTYDQCEVRTGPAIQIIQISAGYYHSLALMSDGTVEAWGHGSEGACVVPVGLSNVVEVSAGYYWSMALKSDGTVVAWGLEDDGQCAVTGLTDVVAISAGVAHGLALKTDGTVVAWGLNDEEHRQCDVPGNLNNVVAVSAGQYHSLALKSDGTVEVWGSNTHGQCDVPEGLSDVVAISAGGYHSIALKSDGSVVAWGANNADQIAVPENLNLAGSLSDLTVSDGVLDPEFDPDILNYSVDVGRSANLDITATLANSSNELRIQGQIRASGTPVTISSLAVGSNGIAVEVATPSCGLTRSYMVTVKRSGSRHKEPTVKADFTAGSFKRSLPVEINKVKDVTLSLEKELLEDAFKNARIDSEGLRTVYAEMPKVKGAQSYGLELPASVLDSGEDRKIELKSEVGTMTLPGNMLEGLDLESGRNIGISIGVADKSNLSKEIKDLLSGKPMVELKLLNGNKTIEWDNPDAPVTVSIPYKPTAEELTDPEHITIWYMDGKGDVVEVPSGRYDPTTGIVTFSTTHFSDYAVVYVIKTFNDLGSVEWAKDSVEILASKGILKGMSEKEFSPQTNIIRADFLYFLVRTLDVDAKFEGNFSDIRKDAYYYKEIGIAKKLGITTGTGNNKFTPDASITRQDMMVLTERTLRMLGKLENQGAASDLEAFNDTVLIKDYAIDSIASLVKEGLIVGSNDTISPLSNTTRAEASVFLYRIYNMN